MVMEEIQAKGAFQEQWKRYVVGTAMLNLPGASSHPNHWSTPMEKGLAFLSQCRPDPKDHLSSKALWKGAEGGVDCDSLTPSPVLFSNGMLQ